MAVPDLSAFGLAPAPGGPTPVPVPGSSAASPPGAPAPATPGFSRLRLDVCGIGDLLFPPSPTDGRATLTFEKGIKKDNKSGAGKAAPKTTVTQIEPAVGKLLLLWKKSANGRMTEQLKKIPPGSGPFTISHANAELFNVSSVLITKWNDGPHYDDFQNGTLTIELEEIPLGAGTGVLLLFKGKTDAGVSIETGGLGPNEVSRWQTFLIAQGFGAILGTTGADGKFGDGAAAATKAFQTREAIKVDGIVGPETFAVAAKFGYKAPPSVKILGAGGTKTAGAAKDKVVPSEGDGFDQRAPADQITDEQRRADISRRRIAAEKAGITEAGDP